MHQLVWRNRIRKLIAGCVRVPYDLVVTREKTGIARLEIEVRQFDKRDDEIEYWSKELNLLPGIRASYVAPRSGSSWRIVTFTLREKKDGAVE